MLELRIQLCGCLYLCSTVIGRVGERAAWRESVHCYMCFYESPESSHVGAEKGHIRVVNKSLLGVFQ